MTVRSCDCFGKRFLLREKLHASVVCAMEILSVCLSVCLFVRHAHEFVSERLSMYVTNICSRLVVWSTLGGLVCSSHPELRFTDHLPNP